MSYDEKMHSFYESNT